MEINQTIQNHKGLKIEKGNNILVNWQKQILDNRIKKIKDFPESVRPIEEFIAELNK